jgi:hypothetical protein
MPMKMKRSKAKRLVALPPVRRLARDESRRPAASVLPVHMKQKGAISTRKSAARANEYVCAMERNQNGKYSVRIRAAFGSPIRGSQEGWTLPVYFLASSFNAAMKKLEESLQHLQKNEERLRFWSFERTDDPNFADDLLPKFGLRLDRRREFPRKAAELGVPQERPVPAALLAPVRRILADSVAQERLMDCSDRSVLASD